VNVYQKLQAVQKVATYVQKDSDVKTGGGSYKAVSHDAVTAMVRPHFVEQGIIVVPRLMSSATIDTGRKTSSGNPILRFEGLYEVSFVNADDPKDAVVIPIAAHAEDQGDKAPGKALSYATKYGILKVLLLETGEDDESRYHFASEKLTADDIVLMHDNIQATNTIEDLRERIQDYLARAHEAGDASAHAKIKAWGVEKAATFGASAPNREPVKAKGNGKQPEAAKPEAVVHKPAPASMIRVILAKAKNMGVAEADLLKKHELESLEGISVDLGNLILKSMSAGAE
jgi:hypothetical protein